MSHSVNYVNVEEFAEAILQAEDFEEIVQMCYEVLR